MVPAQLNPLAITIGLFGMAGFLLYRGDPQHAILVAALAVPNAQQAFAALEKEAPALAAMLAELRGIRAIVSSAPVVAASDIPTPVPPVRLAQTPSAPAVVAAVAVVAEPAPSLPDTKK
jgi:hypothetical protein